MRQVPAAEDLHPRALAVLDEPRLHQAVGVDRAPGPEGGERFEIHDRIFGLAAGRQEPPLGQATIEGHLAALEAAGLAAAGASLVPLVALRRGLAVTRPRPTPHPLASLLGARRRAQ